MHKAGREITLAVNRSTGEAPGGVSTQFPVQTIREFPLQINIIDTLPASNSTDRTGPLGIATA
jgi:hypothetical protein